MKPCKHLDYDREKHDDCEIDEMFIFSCRVRYWKWWPMLAADQTAKDPVRSQFCGAGRGRISGIFQCYHPDEMSCHEPEEEAQNEVD